MHRRIVLLFCLCGSVVSVGCAPSFSPLYRDFDIEPVAVHTATVEQTRADSENAPAQASAIYARIRTALAEAGWEEGSSAAPNVVSTEPKTLGDWGLYRVLVTLDVIPIGDRHVRVLFHPVRRYITGGRSKIPYLNSGMRQALLPGLNEAFEAQGLYPIGTPRERDKEEVEGT